jgi:hypothetical protein
MNAVEKIEPQGQVSVLPVQSETAAVLGMIERVARDPSVDIDKMNQLMGWRKEMIADQRRAQFDEAIAAAKAEIPVITKNREVDFTSAKGRTNYRYEDLAEIAKVVSPILSRHGLSYRYRATSIVNEPVTVTCIVSHRSGHFEENTLCAGRDESGNKNSIQAVGSTITYLQRMTLKAALGLAVSNDDDGKTSEAVETITQGQADTIRELLESSGKSRDKFLQWAKIERVEDLRADRYDACVNAIKAPVSK